MKTISILSVLILMAACTGPADEPAVNDMPLVVEGWIEEGEAPVVMVTHAIDLTQDVPSFDDFVEKWGRVTIYDNDRPYILTGRINSGYTPSLIFTSSRLKGKVGHTYRLTIETENDYAEAMVTMEPAPQISSIETIKEDDGYSFKVDVSRTDGVIQFRTRIIGSEGRFYPAFCATLPINDIPSGGFRVTRGIHAAYDEEQADNFSHYFAPGETVMLKVCRIPDELLPFWTAYDNAISLSGNIFLSMPQNCPGNIRGALGYFSASGISTEAISLPAQVH